MASMAMTRLYIGHDMSQLETFCSETLEDILDWPSDTCGGTIVATVRQVTSLAGQNFVSIC